MGLKVSQMAETLIGSEIIRIAAEINALKAKGEAIYNFTIGDFDPAIFPIPQELTQQIIKAYQDGHTNYPSADGLADLRESVSGFIEKYQHLKYDPKDFVIAGGARPLIYSIYQTLIDPGDKIVFPVPSWNNNHYAHLTRSQTVMIDTDAGNDFMPTADQIEPHLHDAALLALCSPQNPTGTVFSKRGLEDICDLVIAENKRRGENRKPLYIMYDQIYWCLTFGNTQHFDPVSLRPELRDYTIFVDGISKAFAATGVRVGWSFGPSHIISKMKSVLTHIGAWAPKAEQVAVGQYLKDHEAVEKYLFEIRKKVDWRLEKFYEGLMKLKSKGYKVDAIAPQAAIYLTVQFDLIGSKAKAGKMIRTSHDTTAYLLNEAKLALVPFYAFGSADDSSWYRLSVGTCKESDIASVMEILETKLAELEPVIV